jgi:hypothetical protein
MADSIRELIIDKVADELATVLKTGNFRTDIGHNVFRAVMPGLTSPSVVVVPQIESITRTAYQTDEHNFPVRIEAYDHFDESVQNRSAHIVGEKLYSDLVKCVFAITWTDSDPTIDAVRWTGGGVPNYPESRDELVGAYADFEFLFNTIIGDPFNQ